MTASYPLNPLTFPLSGTRLIEASAGTGKTYTIAALYVRLILKHGLDKNLQGQALLPPDILVVTFTEAATKELRDRIRSRLSQAARYFSQQVDEADEFLEQLRANYHTSEWPACAYRLKLAANWMDEAAIYTIHGWCNRMLQQHAFDSGHLFRQEVNNDDQELWNQTTRDYWRIFYYPLTEIQCLATLKLARSPEELARKTKPLLAEYEAIGIETQDENLVDNLRDWENWEQERRRLNERARQLWIENRGNLEYCLNTALENRWLNGNQYRHAGFSSKLGNMAQWAQYGFSLKSGELEKFGQQKILAALVKAHHDKTEQLQQPAFQAIDVLINHHNLEPDIVKQLWLHAINWLKCRYSKAKQQAARITFDDMLTRLDGVLHSDRGENLATVIREQYPVALFDEFQDTDPIQYRIIATVYPPHHNPSYGCFMIGDPKQAIYSFRSADIYTYLKAHEATAGHHYTLNTNYRSSLALVNAINQVFLRADQLADGAFRFKTGENNPLPFVEVKAKGHRDDWVIANQPVKALTVWQWESHDAIGMQEYRDTLAEVTASEIVRLLNDAVSGNTGFKSPSGEIVPIQPSDIAILVRSATEAKAIRAALANRRLRSVYLSERDSIYATQEAFDLMFWLKAMAEPRNERKVRTALSTATMGYDWRTLKTLTFDEQEWEQQLECFLEYHQRWQQDGILPALRRLINDYNLSVKLKDRYDGERCLTNLLHLAELLQQASSQLEGMSALIRHLAEQITATEQTAENSVIRLESDANLIKVVTIHKSKGLEYPLVFLPFICSFKEVSGRNLYFRYHDNRQQLCIDLDRSETNQAASDNERLQEDIRLLYVAMTRAQYACWLGIAPIKSGSSKGCQLEKSGMGYVLGWVAGKPASELVDCLSQLKGDCDDIAITVLPDANNHLYRPSDPQKKLESPRMGTAAFADNWWIASYSALQIEKIDFSYEDKSLKYQNEPETAKEDKRKDERDGFQDQPIKNLIGIHSLPRGAETGVLVHELLEQCAHLGFQATVSSLEMREQLISKTFNHRSWDNKRPILSQALSQWLMMPLLEDDDVSFSALPDHCYQAEMEFLLAAENVDVRHLDRLITQNTFEKQSRPQLLPAQVHGFLKGFIDLVFVHNQKYYVVDYKFNGLGDDDSAYDLASLETAMLEKRYDLQSALYLLALHRLLTIRLGAHYDYDQHVGGALYLFLRGVKGSTNGRIFNKPPKSMIESLDKLFLGSADINFDS